MTVLNSIDIIAAIAIGLNIGIGVYFKNWPSVFGWAGALVLLMRLQL